MASKRCTVLFNILFAILTVLVIKDLPAQVEGSDELIEKWTESSENVVNYDDLMEESVNGNKQPVDLNSPDTESLSLVPFLTDKQRKDLQEYREKYGEIFSIYELLSIPGFDSLLVMKIRPYITINPIDRSPRMSPGNLIRFGRHDLMVRMEQSFPKSNGYMATQAPLGGGSNPVYPGNPQKYWFRYQFRYADKLNAGISGEKDPGEQFFKGHQNRGMDYYAFFVNLSNLGMVRSLTIGNFRVNFGQGLTAGTGSSLGSVPGYINNGIRPAGIRPTLGINESSALRGMAATFKIKRLEISGWVSYAPRDAVVTKNYDMENEFSTITSISGSGYHRTQAEVEKKNAVHELFLGVNTAFTYSKCQHWGFKTGVTYTWVRYPHLVQHNSYLYNLFGFSGQYNMYLGFDAQARYKNLYLFGEACRSYNGSIAFIAGCSLYPDQRSGITVIYRNYPPGFINWFGNAFGQNSLNANENGVYITAGSTFGPGISVSGYLDLFAFPWLKYRVDTPTEGQEYGITASWSVTKQCEAGFSFYRKNIRMNAPTGPNSHLHELIDNFTDNFKFNVVWNPRDNLNLKTRIQIKRTGNSQVKQPLGFLLYEEMQFKPRKILAGITLRIGLFDIPDYNSRIYVYEPDVYYGYSVPFFEGTGMRACMVLTAVPIKNITIWFRGGLTIYTDRAFVGSGNDMTEGNTREDVSVQLRFRI